MNREYEGGRSRFAGPDVPHMKGWNGNDLAPAEDIFTGCIIGTGK